MGCYKPRSVKNGFLVLINDKTWIKIDISAFQVRFAMQSLESREEGLLGKAAVRLSASSALGRRASDENEDVEQVGNLSEAEAKRRLLECISLLRERDRDLGVAAEIGQHLLAANAVLTRACERNAGMQPFGSSLKALGVLSDLDNVNVNPAPLDTPERKPQSLTLSESHSPMNSPNNSPRKLSLTSPKNTNSLASYTSTLERQTADLQAQLALANDSLRSHQTASAKQTSRLLADIVTLREEHDREHREKLELRDERQMLIQERGTLRRNAKARDKDNSEDQGILEIMSVKVAVLEKQCDALELKKKEQAESVDEWRASCESERAENQLLCQLLEGDENRKLIIQEQDFLIVDLKAKLEENQQIILHLSQQLQMAGLTASLPNSGTSSPLHEGESLASVFEHMNPAPTDMLTLNSSKNFLTPPYGSFENLTGRHQIQMAKLRGVASERSVGTLVDGGEEGARDFDRSLKMNLHRVPSSDFVSIVSRQGSLKDLDLPLPKTRLPRTLSRANSNASSIGSAAQPLFFSRFGGPMRHLSREILDHQDFDSFYSRFNVDLRNDNDQTSSTSSPKITFASTIPASHTPPNRPASIINLLLADWMKFLYTLVPLPGVAKEYAERVVQHRLPETFNHDLQKPPSRDGGFERSRSGSAPK